MLTDLLTQAADLIAQAPAPTPTPPATPNPVIDTSPVLEFAAQWITPILLIGIGILIISRAKSGRLSEVFTTVGIALLGITVMGSAFILPFIGDDLVRLVIR